MDINELQSYRLSDAVKFNDRLNPRLWGPDEHLLPEVREKLLAIAQDFKEFLGIDLEVQDITISGSNAAYTYTPHSDIDLHLVADLPRGDSDEVYRELFDAKKYQYNDQHDFKIGGYDVELYVQNANEPHHSQGIYSVLNNDWVRVPSRKKPTVDDISVKSKYEDIGRRIDAAIESGDLARMDAMSRKIRDMRQAGLDQHGEFGAENLAFKVLRGNGTLQRLRDARLAAKDQEMSLKEKARVRYGFKKYVTDEDYHPNEEPPGPESKPEMPAGTVLVNVSDVYDWYKLGQDISDLEHANPAAYGKGAPQTILSFGSEPVEHMYKKNLDRLGLKTLDIDRNAKVRDPEEVYRMDESQDVASILKEFVDFVVTKLGIEQTPKIKLRRDPAWSERNNTFGRYVPEENTLYVSVANRHVIDIMRTVAHELTHHRQEEVSPMPDDAGITGSPWEDEANALAGRIMRDFGEQNPDLFRSGDLEEGWREKAGAVAAAACIAGTPGCATTSDVIRDVQTVGRTAQTFKGMKADDAREELITAIKDTLRKGSGQRESVREASGYIPTAKEKNDPRFKMALTVDVHPGQTGKEANKLKLKTDGQGRPQLLMKRLGDLLESIKNETQDDEKSGFVWSDYNELPMTTIMDLAEGYLLKNTNLSESNSRESQRYFQDLFGMGTIPEIGSKYLIALLILVNDRVSVAQDPVIVQVVDQQGPNAYTVKMPDGRLAEFPQRVLRDRAIFNTWFFDDAVQYDKFRSAISLKFSVDLPEGGISQNIIKEDLRPGQVVDLTKNFQNYSRVHARVDDVMPNGRVRLTIIDADALNGKRVLDIGRQILLAPNYVKNSPVITEDQDLLEVKMSPSELERWARSPEAEGIQAGFEAEMIFRDTQRDDHDGDMEPDYDPDTRPDDIDDVINFFSYDEYGYGLSPRAAGRVRDGLYEEYHTWMDEAIEDEWRNVVDEQVADYMEQNVWEDEQDQYRERAAEELGIETSEESAEQSEKIEARARELFDEDVQQEIEDRGRYYDEARDYFSDMMRDNGDYDEGEFLRSQYGYMSDIGNAYNLDWPYWYGRENNGGGRTPDDIAHSLAGVVDGEVKVGSSYHGVTRRPNRWIIEPDTSLDPDESEDAGLEIVSPPMPLPRALEQLQKVIDWGNDEADAYTNSSTGLHMGVSIPHKGGDVDYVKLILFMGDQYVLDKFGRASNTYCRSALEKLKSRVSSARERGELDEAAGQAKMGDALELIKKNLIELAQRYVQGDVGTGKYTSAHIKPGYIEFRSPGGDYLSMADRGEYDDIKNTMLRFARAMYIAGRPDLERKEYAKKLTKLLTQDGKSDSLRLFSDYVSGKINQEELKKQWAAEVLRKEQPAAGGMKEYEVVIDSTGEVVDTLRARNDVDADAQFRARYRDDPRWFQMDLQQKTTPSEPEPEKKPSRRAQIAKKIATRPTVWHVEDTTDGRVLLIAAKTVEGAKLQAQRQDPEFNLLASYNPDKIVIKPATAKERQQYQEQQKDNEQDSQDIEQRLTGGRGRWKVTWLERRDGELVNDSLNIDAANADAAMDNVRSALRAQGRAAVHISAGPADDTPWQRSRQTTRQQEYQIYNPETNVPIVVFMADSDRAAYERIEQYRQQHPGIRVGLRNAPVPGSTEDFAQQRAAQARHSVEIYNPRTGEVLSTAYNATQEEIDAKIRELEQERGVGAGLFQTRPLTRTAEQPRSSIYTGQWTGRWQVKDRQGNTVYTFGGVGNNQEDANRTAHTWLLSQGNRFDDQGPFDVVPEIGQGN